MFQGTAGADRMLSGSGVYPFESSTGGGTVYNEEIRDLLAQVEERLTRIERKIDEIAKAQQCTFKLYDNQDLMEMLHMSYR
ncbi:MAG: hypothetical protein R3Y22_08525, partial [Bacteroidales bacterium]